VTAGAAAPAEPTASSRRNRVDPWGDLHRSPARGLLTGNRGCLVDDQERVVRHHASSLWISCVTEFRDWRWPLAAPHRWTPIFFLDDAVALAAGHRPCGFCRRDAYRSYRDAVSAAVASDARRPLLAKELDALLSAERLDRGRGIERASHRRLWSSPIDSLPTGTIVVDHDRQARLLLAERTMAFAFDGWRDAQPRPPRAHVLVLTPPTSVAALEHGFQPVLHPSAA
jgi:hypothetical protein